MSDRTRRAFVGVTPAPGDKVALDAEESHHVARVLRLRPGDAVSVFDGRGGTWDATIEASTKTTVTVLVGAPRTDAVEPPVAITLHQAIVRPEKLEWVFQKGTEIGVAAFRLIATERSDAPPPSPARLARYRRIILEACKQSGRSRLPTLELDDAAVPGTGTIAIVLSTTPDAPPLAAVLAGPAAPEVWLAVGPEGGFTSEETASLAASGWRPASLGPRVLRTETAGCVAAALILHTWGDLGR